MGRTEQRGVRALGQLKGDKRLPGSQRSRMLLNEWQSVLHLAAMSESGSPPSRQAERWASVEKAAVFGEELGRKINTFSECKRKEQSCGMPNLQLLFFNFQGREMRQGRDIMTKKSDSRLRSRLPPEERKVPLHAHRRKQTNTH